ncbi:tRNA 2-selenouridine(34) synthase MnmH [Oxalicibacterium solurbis]|uniref:tRNA 2-selenouridine synthase n=1 Tax=Oxalicibacterium solurbis TaxID=69280 RepID=A0A8J3AXD7_9BURK|nr:tRNA 2-selenouridine(34) synthase MnmH [Oxalicibacterium solurbis]GGI54667.1 tRNA 2-selenouridine synthase [Oxalicibacterium solurbis]
MKYPVLLPIQDVLSRLDQFDTVIDVRSPGEFEEDHLPGAINCPVLDNDERVKVGTLYRHAGAFEAKKIGAALVAKNIALHIETRFIDRPHNWKPLVYCWRGGNRSGAMAHIFGRIGWQVVQLEGGYKSFRGQVNDDLATLPAGLQFTVLCGPTGSGKSRLLQTLAAQGAQVLDLEQLAAHRGSVLGNLPTMPQPSQKLFDSRIWQLLRSFDPSRPVFVEAESKKVGKLRVPDALMDKMRTSACISVELALPLRVQLLMEDYPHFVSDPAQLNTQLGFLTPLHGKEKITEWQQLALAGRTAEVVETLLRQHYDPGYMQSIRRNFSLFDQATPLALTDISDDVFRETSSQLRAAELVHS